MPHYAAVNRRVHGRLPGQEPREHPQPRTFHNTNDLVFVSHESMIRFLYQRWLEWRRPADFTVLVLSDVLSVKGRRIINRFTLTHDDLVVKGTELLYKEA